MGGYLNFTPEHHKKVALESSTLKPGRFNPLPGPRGHGNPTKLREYSKDDAVSDLGPKSQAEPVPAPVASSIPADDAPAPARRRIRERRPLLPLQGL